MIGNLMPSFPGKWNFIRIPDSLSPLPILTEAESNDRLQLFAVLFETYRISSQKETATKQRLGIGHLLRIRNTVRQWHELQLFLDGRLAGTKNRGRTWELICNSISEDPLGRLLQVGSQYYPSFRIEQVAQLFDTAIWVLQAHSTGGKQDLQRKYSELANRYGPSGQRTIDSSDEERAVRIAKSPSRSLPAHTQIEETSEQSSGTTSQEISTIFLQDPRQDELGDKLSINGLTVWHASSSGRKAINQDATAARSNHNGIAFALTDGVSSSVASRQAAALASTRFVEVIGLLGGQEGCFRKASQEIQQQLEVFRQWLLVEAPAETVQAISGALPVATMRAFLQQTTDKHSGTRIALATTLIGGWVEPKKEGGALASVARFGDGLVEVFRSETNQAKREMDMDPAEYRVTQFLSPLSRSAEFEPEMRTIDLSPGDWLLLSSDGLARGEQEILWEELTSLLGSSPDKFLENCGSASIMLAELKQRIQKFSPELFDDNWSVLLIRVGRQEA